MKKWIGILALLLACLGLCSCTQETQESGTYLIYYTNEAADQLTQQEYTPQQEEGEELLWELLSRMKNPEVLTVKSAIPQKVEVSQLQLQDGHLSLDFNSPYKELDNVAEALLRAAVVQTLIQAPQVEDIRFTVEGAALYDIPAWKSAPWMRIPLSTLRERESTLTSMPPCLCIFPMLPGRSW